MKQKLIGVTGYKNSGKTTLVEKLVHAFKARGLVVSTVKHTHYPFEIDHEGRDSYRHRKAGAREIAIINRLRWAIVHENGEHDEPEFDEIIAKMQPCDLIIVEGYKTGPQPKIEVRDVASGRGALDNDDGTIIAVAASEPVKDEKLPVFMRDDALELAEFIAEKLELS